MESQLLNTAVNKFLRSHKTLFKRAGLPRCAFGSFGFDLQLLLNLANFAEWLITEAESRGLQLWAWVHPSRWNGLGEKQKCAKWSASQPATEVYLPAFLPAVEGQAFALLANSINQLVMKRDIFVDGGSGFPTQVPGVSQGSSEETTEKPINALGFYQLQFPVS